VTIDEAVGLLADPEYISFFAMSPQRMVLGGGRVPLRACRDVYGVGPEAGMVIGWSVTQAQIPIVIAGVLSYIVAVLPNGTRVGCTPADVGVATQRVEPGVLLEIVDMLVRQPPATRVRVS
jgi:hypothetical protein